MIDYRAMGQAHPSLTRGQVWCRSCGRTEKVSTPGALQHGWPKCCSATMTIDAPDGWWTPIARNPLYEVNGLGTIRRAVAGKRALAGTVLRPGRDRKGYLCVALYDGDGRSRTQRVHVLVAEAFLGPAPAGKQVNHKDRDKTNPRLANLEYMTAAENVAHSHRGRLIPGRRGEESGRAKLTEADVHLIRRRLKFAPDRELLGVEYGVSKVTIDRLATGRTWAWLAEIDSPEEQAALAAAREAPK